MLKLQSKELEEKTRKRISQWMHSHADIRACIGGKTARHITQQMRHLANLPALEEELYKTRYSHREIRDVLRLLYQRHTVGPIDKMMPFLITMIENNRYHVARDMLLGIKSRYIEPKNTEACTGPNLLSNQPKDHITSIYNLCDPHTIVKMLTVSRRLNRLTTIYMDENQGRFFEAEYESVTDVTQRVKVVLAKRLCQKYPRTTYLPVAMSPPFNYSQLLELHLLNSSACTGVRVEFPQLLRLKCIFKHIPRIIAPALTDFTLTSSRDKHIGVQRIYDDMVAPLVNFMCGKKLQRVCIEEYVRQNILDALGQIPTLKVCGVHIREEDFKIPVDMNGGACWRFTNSTSYLLCSSKCPVFPSCEVHLKVKSEHLRCVRNATSVRELIVLGCQGTISLGEFPMLAKVHAQQCHVERIPAALQELVCDHHETLIRDKPLLHIEEPMMSYSINQTVSYECQFALIDFTIVSNVLRKLAIRSTCISQETFDHLKTTRITHLEVRGDFHIGKHSFEYLRVTRTDDNSSVTYYKRR